MLNSLNIIKQIVQNAFLTQGRALHKISLLFFNLLKASYKTHDYSGFLHSQLISKVCKYSQRL